MKISIMREYVRLAANKNYSKTAEELFVAQSALSRHIASLETELNTKLINRDRNGFALTPTGELVLKEFKKILSEYEHLLDQIASQEGIEKGELHLGYLYYDADFYVSRIRDVFRKKYPNITLVLHAYQPMQLEEELLSGKIDAAVLYGVSETVQRALNYFPFLKIPYSLIYHKSHRFADVRDISIADLDGEKLLCPCKPFAINHVGDKMEQMLREGGARIREKIPVYNYDEVPWLMEETGAIYISPMVNNRAYGSNTQARFLLPDIYCTDVSVVWLKERKNPAIKYLNAAIKTCYP